MTAPGTNLSQCLRGVHHIGITVEDMGKALEFYTEVLGGHLIIGEEGLAGDTMHNTLLQHEELEAALAGVEPRERAVPNLRDGAHLLDVYFVQFANVVLELLQYRDAAAPPKGPVAYPARHVNGSSPAYVNAMHLSFYLNDDVDVDRFAADLEAECQRRGGSDARGLVRATQGVAGIWGNLVDAYGRGDGRARPRESYSEKRFLALLEAGAPSPAALVERLVSELRTHIGTADQFDDITLLATRWTPT